MRGRKAELYVISQLDLAHVELPIVEHVFLVEFGAQHRFENIPRILQPVDVADFVAVKSGDRDFHNPHPGEVQLHDDVGVEMEIVRVPLEGNLRERLHGIQPVAAVKLAELRAEQRVLKLREHLIADPFVERHPAFERVGFVDHPRAKHGVRFLSQKWFYQLRQLLRRVLPVAVDERHDVESVIDRVAVAEFLIAAVALIFRVAQHHDLERPALPLALQPGVKSGVLAEVVDDQHFHIGHAEFGGDAVEDALDGFLGVVGDDENEQAFFGKVDGHGGGKGSWLSA